MRTFVFILSGCSASTNALLITYWIPRSELALALCAAALAVLAVAVAVLARRLRP